MDCRWAVEGKEVLSRKQRRPQKPEPHKPRRNHLQYTHTVFWRWSGPVRVRCCVLTHTHTHTHSINQDTSTTQQ